MPRGAWQAQDLVWTYIVIYVEYRPHVATPSRSSSAESAWLGVIGQVENLLTNGRCAEESLRRTARFSQELAWFSWDGKEASDVAHTVRSKTRA